MMNKHKSLILSFLFITVTILLQGQEKVCIPSVWVGESVKGVLYLDNGDSLSGKFTHLTPYNDIKTTHIVYKGSKGAKGQILRSEIAGYYDSKNNVKRWKVYTNSDSTVIRKGCFLDQGKFFEVIRSGQFTLLKDKLHYNSDIESYSLSATEDVYYILLEDGKLIKMIMTNYKTQLMSMMSKEQIKAYGELPSKWDVVAMIDIIDFLNAY